MGWIGGADPLSHVRLRFPNREAAIAYARRQGLAFEVREPTHVHRGGLVRVPMRDVGDASPGVRSAAILSLGVVYWLVRGQDQRLAEEASTLSAPDKTA
jgi:hypothetical protein